MVADAVPKDARLIRAATALALVGLALPAVASAQNEARVVVIDLAPKHPPAREQAAKAIADVPGIALTNDAELAKAAIGDVSSGAASRGREAAAALARASGCSEKVVAAKLAILELAAAEAAGHDVRAELRTAYAELFRCAHDSGDASAALRHAQILRQLGGSKPDGVDDATWATYPSIDAAANVTLAAVTIESPTPGAEVWIDHTKRGVTPLAIDLTRGDHIVAVSAAGGVAAKAVHIKSWTHTETLAPAPALTQWSEVAALVVSLRAGTRGADAKAIAELLSLAGADLAIVVVGGPLFEAWAKDDDGARSLGARRDAKQAAELVAKARVGARAPDPDVPLLRETDAERAKRNGETDEEKPAKWWVYGAILGAAAIGAGIIVFGQSSDDRQRIEITLP